jgi:DNA-binding response OmpR family regulator
VKACVVADPELLVQLQEEAEPRGDGCGHPEQRGFLVLELLPCAALAPAWQPPPSDLYVLPAARYLDLAPELRPFPAFAYGWPGLMAECFRQGASDYLRSPWNAEELEARALRFLRIRLRLGLSSLEFSGRRLSLSGGPSARPVPVGAFGASGALVPSGAFVPSGDIAALGRGVELSECEYRLARILVLNLNNPVPRDALALALWGRPRSGSRAVDVHVSSLRRRLDLLEPGLGRFLVCSRREGYRLVGEYCG